MEFNSSIPFRILWRPLSAFSQKIDIVLNGHPPREHRLLIKAKGLTGHEGVSDEPVPRMSMKA